ncbi:MAG: cobalt-zinc-cadmium efflux system membrane fusion protein [Saprospiraceae bacterium]|jgi:cobalt-zinc-cadmium efflux system membrane fusion protein
MNRILYLIMGICLCTGIISCHSHGEEGHSREGDAAHAHEVEYPTNAHTGWTSKTEIFVEYPVLAVGKISKFAAHFSSMATFKPLTIGQCEVKLLRNNKRQISGIVDGPSSPGIFRPEITPTEAGVYDLAFYIESESIKDTIIVKDVMVYKSEHDAIHEFAVEGEDNDVSFLKEQAWKIDFAVTPAERKEVPNIIRASGEVLPIESDEESISATTSGIIIFKSSNLLEGQNISKGSSLFVVNNDKMISSNLSEKYAVLKANLLQSQTNLERSKDLLEKGIVSQKKYDNRNRQYQVDLAGFETMTKNYSSGGMVLKAPTSGILMNLHVVNGQYVKEGQSIATISRNKHLLIEAEVSQKYFQDIPKIVSANIKLPWSKSAISINEYNGKLVTTARTAKDHYIPVLFKIENKGDIIPGTYLDIYLKTSDVTHELVIPKTALLREYDMYFVYVMTAGESFEKRNVTIGIDDGKMVQILSGLKENEMVVTRGVYAIKMASMSSTIPAHGHEH